MKSWVTRSLIEAAGRLTSTADADLIADLSKIAELAETQFEEAFWLPETEELLSEIQFARSIKDVSHLTCAVRGALGLQHLTLVAVRETPGTIFRRRMVTTFSRDWMQEHMEARYQLWDPLFAEPAQDGPVFLDELADGAPVVAQFLAEARCAGIGPSGLIAWTEVAPETIVAVMATSIEEAARFRSRVERIECDMTALSTELARAFARANGLLQFDLGALTDEELALLRAIAVNLAGRAVLHPDREFALSAACSLCRRVGARSLGQAALAAASSGFLSYAPLRMEDVWIAELPSAKELGRQEAHFRPGSSRSQPGCEGCCESCP